MQTFERETSVELSIASIFDLHGAFLNIKNEVYQSHVQRLFWRRIKKLKAIYAVFLN